MLYRWRRGERAGARWYATKREAINAALNNDLATKDRATGAIELLPGVGIEVSDTDRKPPPDKRY